METTDMKDVITNLLEELYKEKFQTDYCRRIDIESQANIFLGLDINKEPYFRFIASDVELDRISAIRPKNGFRIKQEDLTLKDYPSCTAFRISKGKSVDKDMFISFIADLAKTASPEGSGISELINRLIQWSVFFKNCPEGVLSIKQQIGLFGELDFSLHFVQKGLPEIIDHWKGPDKAAKDYVFKDSAVEVKTTLRDDKNRIQISNEFQLDSEGFYKLFLYFLIVSEDNIEGQTLPEQIDAIRYHLAKDKARLNTFEDLLKKAGYEETFRDRYSIRFVSESFFCYEVSSEFPRITPANLVHGITSVSYMIDIAVCNDFQLPISKFDQFVSKRVKK